MFQSKLNRKLPNRSNREEKAGVSRGYFNWAGHFSWICPKCGYETVGAVAEATNNISVTCSRCRYGEFVQLVLKPLPVGGNEAE
jgi:hypothetical protein